MPGKFFKNLKLVKQFKEASGHWIPFRLAHPGENIDDFDHKNYTELVFKSVPKLWQLERKFNLIIYDDDAPGLKLIQSIWTSLADEKKERFYRNFAMKLNKSISENKGINLFPGLVSPEDAIARSQIYLDKLEKLFTAYYFQNEVKTEIKNLEKSITSLPLRWRTTDSFGKDINGHVKNYLAWASIPFETDAAELELTEEVKNEYFISLGRLVGIEILGQPSSNITSAKKSGSFADIAKSFVEKCEAYKPQRGGRRRGI